MKSIRIGAGAGYSGDRIEPAIDLIKRGELDYICFECLAERTISIAVAQREQNPELGYNELLEWRFERIFAAMKENRDAGENRAAKVITNMGAANPVAAAEKVAEIARKHGMGDIKIAAVTGDDISDKLGNYYDCLTIETGQPLSAVADRIVSANAYMGIGGIVEALGLGADIVITGRVADPSLILAPLVYEFGWAMDDYARLGKGTVAGHLLECAAQVSGGYYADPGYKDVPELWNIGFPIAEVDEDGNITISKLAGTGGLISKDTVKEQLVYEIHDPKKYFTPDVVADFSAVRVEETGENTVRVTMGSGTKKTGRLKTSVGCHDGWIGEGEISYGGPGALDRARLAGEILIKRLEMLGLTLEESRVDYIGYSSLFTERLAGSLSSGSEPPEVRVRLAVRAMDRGDAVAAVNEVEALYLNGPYGGGGATKSVKPVMSVLSVLVPEADVTAEVHMIGDRKK